jgi:hypothetical protein
MADYTKNARTVINGFLWNELNDSVIMLAENYRPDGFTKGIIPIVPIQEIPEFNNLIPDKPYITYDYEVEGYGMLYTIISTSVSKISEITEFMIDLFRRLDDSGKDVQLYNPLDDKIRFYSVGLNNATAPAPFEQEGGRMSGSVEIQYKYARILDGSGRFQ